MNAFHQTNNNYRKKTFKTRRSRIQRHGIRCFGIQIVRISTNLTEPFDCRDCCTRRYDVFLLFHRVFVCTFFYHNRPKSTDANWPATVNAWRGPASSHITFRRRLGSAEFPESAGQHRRPHKSQRNYFVTASPSRRRCTTDSTTTTGNPFVYTSVERLNVVNRKRKRTKTRGPSSGARFSDRIVGNVRPGEDVGPKNGRDGRPTLVRVFFLFVFVFPSARTKMF